jgi:hypothetical protein
MNERRATGDDDDGLVTTTTRATIQIVLRPAESSVLLTRERGADVNRGVDAAPLGELAARRGEALRRVHDGW